MTKKFRRIIIEPKVTGILLVVPSEFLDVLAATVMRLCVAENSNL